MSNVGTIFYLGKKVSVDLEKNIIPAIGISKNKESIPTPANLR